MFYKLFFWYRGSFKSNPWENIMAYFFALKTTYDSFDRFIKFV